MKTLKDKIFRTTDHRIYSQLKEKKRGGHTPHYLVSYRKAKRYSRVVYIYPVILFNEFRISEIDHLHIGCGKCLDASRKNISVCLDI